MLCHTVVAMFNILSVKISIFFIQVLVTQRPYRTQSDLSTCHQNNDRKYVNNNQITNELGNCNVCIKSSKSGDQKLV